MIIGSSGAGKSTLSRAIQARTGYELFHIDQLYWKPHWVESSQEELRTKLQAVVEKDTWIIDGNYNATIDLRLKYADTIVFLDVNRWLCAYRAIKRRFQYFGQSRPDMTVDCPEKFDKEFILFMKYILHDFPIHKKPRIFKLLHTITDQQQAYILRNRTDIQQFLSNCQQRVA